MIVCKPTWTRRPKQYHTVWWHEWKEVPFVSGRQKIQTGNVVCRDFERGRYVAAVYSWGTRTDLGEFPTIDEAQAACDDACAERLGTTFEEAARNWRTWTKEKRATAKREREQRARENEAKLTPEARERSRRLADALDIELSTSRPD